MTSDREGRPGPAQPYWLPGSIPLGGAVRRGDVPRPRMEREKPKLDPEVEELLQYLDEVLADYERMVVGIGELGVTAPMTLYYRDEIQETLDLLEDEPGLDNQPFWLRTVELDNQLKANKQALVDEIGHANFKQYQIINDPPKERWWWYLNAETKAPPPPPTWWQFWKKD